MSANPFELSRIVEGDREWMRIEYASGDQLDFRVEHIEDLKEAIRTWEAKWFA